MKKIIIPLIVVCLVGVVAYFWMQNAPKDESVAPENTNVVVGEDQSKNNTPTPEQPAPAQDKTETVIGKSAGGRDLIAYHYGAGAKEILFVGGIHGGYEWNTVLVAYQAMEYLKANPSVIPSGIKVTVIPVLNPDGLSKVVGTSGMFSKTDVTASQAIQVAGRFNANNVDLNRNFDCDWQAQGVWQDKTVSGGASVFSEPESQAIKTYVETRNPVAALVWYSSAGGVFASNCHAGVLPETRTIMNAFSKASGYPAYDAFDFYKITGDMVNWLAKKGIPAISVLLTTHEDTEWSKNQAGIDAFLGYYAK